MENCTLRLLSEIKEYGRAASSVFLDGPYAGERIITTASGEKVYNPELADVWESPGLISENGTYGEIRPTQFGNLFDENLTMAPRLVILGGGHISLPLSRIGRMLDFYVTVIDERPEFANRERFTDADEVISADYADSLSHTGKYKNTYYVVVTPGHIKDTLCAGIILANDFTYFGMIGSRAKVASVRKVLEGQGISPQKIDTMHAPIGIPLGGQTPAEIAVSIAAELVLVRNRAGTMEIQREIPDKAVDRSILVSIVKRVGSSPRGTGSKMLAGPDGWIAGTVGGGAVEYAALKKCAEMLAHGDAFHTEEYDLSDVSGLGMICGGKITLLYENMS